MAPSRADQTRAAWLAVLKRYKLDPDAIAENYWRLHLQPRSAWTHELDLRPWIETW